jgi:hypothetical protein
VGSTFVQQTFTLTDQAAISGPSEFSMTTSSTTALPTQAGPYNYLGAGVVREWIVDGGPIGLTMNTANALYGGTYPNTSAIIGNTQQTGIFDATVSAIVDTTADITTSFSVSGTALTRFDFPVKIDISGGLFIAWLHADPSIYDLQIALRGDGGGRVVRSLYEVAPMPASQVTKYFSQGSDGSSSATSVSSTPAASGRTLGIKRGDHLKLAIVIRDGDVFPNDSVLSDVKLTLRLPGGEDDEPVLTASGTWVAVGANGYFLIEIQPGNELDDLFDESGLQAIPLKGELEWKYNGTQRMSSQAFDATLFESIVPLDA